MPNKGRSAEELAEYGKNTRFVSGSRAAEMGRKGGKASQLKEKNTRTMTQLAKMISSAPVSEKNIKALETVGIDSEDATNNALVVAGVFREAVKGKKDAVDKWQELTAIDDKDERPFKIPAELVASSFVDLNREVEPNISYYHNHCNSKSDLRPGK